MGEESGQEAYRQRTAENEEVQPYSWYVSRATAFVPGLLEDSATNVHDLLFVEERPLLCNTCRPETSTLKFISIFPQSMRIVARILVLTTPSLCV